jgi:hypothetical protein
VGAYGAAAAMVAAAAVPGERGRAERGYRAQEVRREVGDVSELEGRL